MMDRGENMKENEEEKKKKKKKKKKKHTAEHVRKPVRQSGSTRAEIGHRERTNEGERAREQTTSW